MDHGALPHPPAMITRAGRAAALGRLIGWVAVGVSMGYIGLQLAREAPWELAAAHMPTLLATALAGALLYGIAGFLLSSAWLHLLAAKPSPGSKRWHHAVYGRTQIAKYLPGNVFHLVGRQVMGRRLGHRQAPLALASLLETFLLLLMAAILSLPIVWSWLDRSFLWGVSLMAIPLALLAFGWLLRRHHPTLHSLAPGSGENALNAALSIGPRLLRPALFYALFFFVTAVILWMLAKSVEPPGGPSLSVATSIPVVALAWLVGFVTPGSSAGIGVREAVLITLLEPILGGPGSVLIALALRIVSMGGDGAFFFLSTALVANEPAKLTALDEHTV
ncbi:MAG: hypothetical protein AAF637_07325 [Pseudomonadota bacterium]